MDSSQNGPGGVNSSNKSYMSRAEQFEFEKKRIIESCFSKREDGGSVSESYITHLRMEEDANYPSTPPPPMTSSESKKPRIIIVAVRKTGRVRVHKARENANGTFSIGKTWLLDDLVAVQSYTGAAPAGPDEETYKQWAGNAGFTVSFNKPYYWKANSQKEKLFFIASLIKIYYKYTGGNLPELIGFDQREREQLPGATTRPAPTTRQSETPTSTSSQLPNRDPTRVAPIQSDGDTGLASPSFTNGVPSINKPQPRPPRRSLTGSIDATLQIPGSPRAKPQFRRLATDVGQQSNQQAFSQGDGVANFSPQSRDTRNNNVGRIQNSGVKSDQRPSPLDGGFLGERLRENSSSDLRPMPAPLSLPTETRRPSISSFASSRERLPGLSDVPELAPLTSDIPILAPLPSDTPVIAPLPLDNGSTENSKAHEIKKNKSPIERVTKELSSIGVDPLILSGRGGDLVSAWDQFGWVGEGIRTKNIDQMRDEVERELCRIQADGWLSRLEEEDERIEAIKMGFDNVIEECDELDGLLTLYLVELGTLNEDVAYIEAQSQGLQVQTANQKLLKTELESLLQTISISSDQIESLRESSLESTRGLSDIEKSLVILFKAMLTIDPSLGVSGPRNSEDVSLVSGKPGGFGNSEIGSMRVLQEKKDV